MWHHTNILSWKIKAHYIYTPGYSWLIWTKKRSGLKQKNSATFNAVYYYVKHATWDIHHWQSCLLHRWVKKYTKVFTLSWNYLIVLAWPQKPRVSNAMCHEWFPDHSGWAALTKGFGNTNTVTSSTAMGSKIAFAIVYSRLLNKNKMIKNRIIKVTTTKQKY